MTTKMSIALLVTASVALPSIAAHVPSHITLAKEQHLYRGNGAEPHTIDPTFVCSTTPGNTIVNDMFEGLVIENSRGIAVPGQAIEWRISNGGLTYTFILRDNLQWSNGHPVTAHDFVFAWRRAIDPKTQNSTGHYFVTANILNAREIHSETMPPEQLGVTAIDDKTLKITLTKSTPYFISLMSAKTFLPLPRHVVLQHGSNWTRPENITSNGAFILKQWLPNDRLDVVKNPKYWDHENTIIEQVTYKGIYSQQAELQHYQAGKLDITNRVQWDQYQLFKDKSPDEVKRQPLLGTYVYTFNTTAMPFNDPRVRRALTMAINREALTNQELPQNKAVAMNIVPTTIRAYESAFPNFADLPHSEQLLKAQQLLKEAGYSKTNPLRFSLIYNQSENQEKTAVTIAKMWEPLNVFVDLKSMEWNDYLAAKRSGQFQLARSWTFGEYAEPSSILNAFTCQHPDNESGYCNPVYDQYIAQASGTDSQQRRYALYSKAESLLLEASPVIPLYHYSHTRLVNKKLKGIPENNPTGNIYAKDLYFIE